MYGLPTFRLLRCMAQNLSLTFRILDRFVAVAFFTGLPVFRKLLPLENYPLTLNPTLSRRPVKNQAFLCCGPSPSSSSAGHVCQGQPDAGLLPSCPKDPEGL